MNKISLLALLAVPAFLSAQDSTKAAPDSAAKTTATPTITATPAPVQMGAIIGVVNDSAGVPIPYALILATRDSTGAKNRVMADPKGIYAIDGIVVGESYTLSVVRMGFEPEMRTGVVLPDTSAMTIDFYLDRNPAEKFNKAQPLPGITVKAKKGGSRLAQKYLGYDEIQKVNVPDGLSLIQRIRPGFLGPEYDICMTNDSLSLYVDGVRRPPINPMDDNAAFQSMGVNLGITPSRSIQMGRNRGRTITAERTNEDIIADELSKIPREEIYEIKYVGCGDWDPSIGKRDVIWVTTLWSKRAKNIEKFQKEKEKIQLQQAKDSIEAEKQKADSTRKQ